MRVEEMISDTLKKGYNLFIKQFVALIIGTVIALFLMVFIITIPPLIFGLYYMCVQLVRGKKVRISDVFKGFDYFFTSWGLFIVAFVAVVFGLMLLVIPGLLLMVLFQYAVAVAILERRGAIASLQRSFEIGKEHLAYSVVLWIILAVIQSVGGITRVGVLITIPFATLCICVATKKLTAKTRAK